MDDPAWPFWPTSPRKPRDARVREGDVPPETTGDGHYVLYHGTTAGRAKAIFEGGFAADGVGKIGFGTRPEAVRVFAQLKADHDDDDLCVLKCVVDAAWVSAHTVKREGDHKNLWLFHRSDWRPGIKLPVDALRSIDIHEGPEVENAPSAAFR